MPLSVDDQQRLEMLEASLQIIRDRVRGVVGGYRNDLYLWGEGGIGKSYAVLSTLEKLKANFVLNNSRLTGRGLFDLLREYADQVHVLEDCEGLTADRKACGVLLSALWGQTNTEHRQERLVTWRNANQRVSFYFKGAVIAIGNRPLDNLPELRALQTRIPVLQLTATNGEIAALMRPVSEEGFRILLQRRDLKSLTAEQCSQVCEFIISETHSLARNLDMRILINSFRDFLEHQDEQTQTHWKDLVRSELKQQAAVPESRADRLARERQIALEIAALPGLSSAERERLFRQKTGTSGRGYRRRLKEARG